jgi:multicomponent Na+:H+ antiporter subunit D
MYLILLTVLLPLVLGVCLYFGKIENRNLKNVIIASIVGVVAVINILLTFFKGEFNLFKFTESLQVGFMIDGLGSFFSIAISIIWLLVTIYSFEYMKHEENENKFYCFYLLTFASLMGMCYARNLISAYVFFELVSLCSFPLVMHSKTKESIKAAMKYLFYSLGGAFVALIGVVMLSFPYGILDFNYGGYIHYGPACCSCMGSVPYHSIATFLCVIGFGAKAGMFPLQSWLPTAHPVAPSNASALLSGVITKAGVFLIIRTLYFVASPSVIDGTIYHYVLIILALITIILGSSMAWSCKDIKKRLAYSSVSQISYILLGLFMFNKAALVGSLIHVLAHMCIKVTLFLVAGAMIYKTHKRNVDDLNGIGKAMPIVMVCFSIASLGLVGVPPLSGFYSKWFIASGALATSIGALKYIACAVLLVSAILTAAYLLPIMIKGFFTKDVEVVKVEPNKLMTIPLIILVSLVFLVGMFSGYIVDFIQGLM